MGATKFLLFFGIATVVASATSVTFTFGTQVINGITVTGIGENAPLTGTNSITSYMNSVLAAAGCSTCTVTVSGAFADTTWNGDGHTTGPGTGSKSLTLGNSTGATASNTNSSINGTLDTFLATTNDGDTSTDSQITMTFSGMTIGSSSFDYEIFPDISCTELDGTGHTNSCGTSNANLPSFTFATNNGSIFTTNAVMPGMTDGNAVDSPSGSAITGNNPETAPQYIGTWSGSVSSATQLDFIDWPATIGVDNLNITFTPNGTDPVPEPVSVLLLGTVLAGLAMRKRFRKAA